MASTTHSTHLPALGEPHQRNEVARRLQAMLIELIDLSLLGRQLRWNVVGPLFRALHLQFDELTDSWRALAEIVAGRPVAIGVAPDGESATVAADTSLRRVDRAELEDRDVVCELTSRMADVAERALERIDRLGELDTASQDVVIEVVRALEKQLWIIRAQFPDSESH